ncbi:RBBP9/YdeN family alpha/beta hydrolase [Nonomuraea basaltis]|uniref:RBBP9/YdeN family alpha/beta hydrolase n=1 Tax=Nonomuraea basaltis TaxID=2495887 RepID=UPI00110C49B1|nr:alpha/beta hydrolase [Nonomuraea basaltis]TMR91114.1 alpha/beta hydrolase [Nonomuraea basaltis]
MRYVIIPGINGSDEDHWQSIWQAEWGPSTTRISPSSWDEPDLDDWCQAIDKAVRQSPSADVVLVAHSLGCLAATCWIARHRPDIRGVLLVAPPDNAGPTFPADAFTFTAVKATPLHVPGLVISSDNDPYCSPDVALRLAADWQYDRVSVGLAGHINSASRLGRWDFGRALLTAFTAGTRRP